MTRYCFYLVASALLSCIVLVSSRATADVTSTATSPLQENSSHRIASKSSELPTEVSQAEVWGLDFNPDGSRIAAGSAYQIDVWEWAAKRLVVSVIPPKGAQSLGSSNPLKFSPDGSLLAVCGSKAVGDVVLRIWNTRDWSIAHDIVDHSVGGCDAFGFTPDGKYLIYVIDRSGFPGDNLVVVEVNAWQVAWSTNIEFFDPVSLAISPNGQQVAVAGTLTILPPATITDVTESLRKIIQDPQISIVDVRQRKVMRMLKTDVFGPIDWSPDNRRISVAGFRCVDIFDAQSGAKILRGIAEGTTHMNARFSPDGRLFMDSDMNGRGTGRGLFLWDRDRHKVLQRIEGNVSSIAFSASGRYLAAGASGNTSIWRVK